MSCEDNWTCSRRQRDFVPDRHASPTSRRRSAKPSAQAQRGRPRPVLVQIPQDVLNGSERRRDRRARDSRATAAPSRRSSVPRRTCWRGRAHRRSMPELECIAPAPTRSCSSSPSCWTHPCSPPRRARALFPEDHPLAVGNRWTGEPELIKLLESNPTCCWASERVSARRTRRSGSCPARSDHSHRCRCGRARPQRRGRGGARRRCEDGARAARAGARRA